MSDEDPENSPTIVGISLDCDDDNIDVDRWMNFIQRILDKDADGEQVRESTRENLKAKNKRACDHLRRLAKFGQTKSRRNRKLIQKSAAELIRALADQLEATKNEG